MAWRPFSATSDSTRWCIISHSQCTWKIERSRRSGHVCKFHYPRCSWSLPQHVLQFNAASYTRGEAVIILVSWAVVATRSAPNMTTFVIEKFICIQRRAAMKKKADGLYHCSFYFDRAIFRTFCFKNWFARVTWEFHVVNKYFDEFNLVFMNMALGQRNT